ncbi:unnamed protein product [Dovyalis caffra]|uniref:GH18 domain-containing protein n=1 Tax=Dovyalis caffra TaxID=77055 RepID=A0AAV1SL39_9ROSI|nr:unnamed protein product [Dovyalis caffra]
MSSPKITTPFVLVIICSIISNCESNSPPSSYPTFDPPPDDAYVSPAPSPAQYSPEPATPSYQIPYVPAVPAYPPEPATPSYPIPYLPAVPAYPPEPATPSYPIPYLPAVPAFPPEPATPSYPIPSPSAVPAYPEVPASPPLPTPPPAPSSYPPIPASPAPCSLPPERKGIKGAYWPSFDGFEASAIDTSYFTHIFYAFLLPDNVTFRLAVTPFDQQKIPGFIETLRARNPPVKTLISMGGGGGDAIAAIFANLSSAKETRKIFIDSTIEVARAYGFDGLDLDWEFPANDQEMINFGLLFKEWHEALVHEAKTSGKPRLLLTAAVYYSSQFTTYGLPRSYPADSINKYADWINPMCYDYHGSWENFTGPNAALFDPNGNLSTSFGIGSWIQAGVSPKKLAMGLPLYGRTWKLSDPNVHGIGAETVGVGPGDGILVYDQILEFNRQNNTVINFDEQTVSYYSYAGGYWVGYDDSVSIDWKVQFARSRDLGGYFFWALGQDKDWIISKQASNSWDR